jgi:hypothetical protein
VENLVFNRLTAVERSSLTKPFSEMEVKGAVRDCDNFKSLGPGGINFGFFKDFWVELKGDVMQFTYEFHRNGKLTKGLYSTLSLSFRKWTILNGSMIFHLYRSHYESGQSSMAE